MKKPSEKEKKMSKTHPTEWQSALMDSPPSVVILSANLLFDLNTNWKLDLTWTPTALWNALKILGNWKYLIG